MRFDCMRNRKTVKKISLLSLKRGIAISIVRQLFQVF